MLTAAIPGTKGGDLGAWFDTFGAGEATETSELVIDIQATPITFAVAAIRVLSFPITPQNPYFSPMSEKPYHHLPRNRTVEIAPGVSLEFVLVLPGTFVMGDARDGWDAEKPEHRVRITQPFYLGKYPVTQVQWAAIMEENPAHFKGDEHRPVESVSWGDIVKKAADGPSFLARLPEVRGYTYRLPTEAEWEYAAKGGHLATQTDERVPAENLYPAYAGGEDANAAAWQSDNNEYSTLRTGYRQPNILGLYGMSGNVYDWCQDTFDSEAYAKRTQNQREISDPLDESGRFRVVRGGSWIVVPWSCRSASPTRWPPSARSRIYGFRLVLSPSSGALSERWI
jgi:formylglycine-generating enzyme required for sulfatase activity